MPAGDANEAAVTGRAVVGELKADIDGVEYSVATSFDPAGLPEGYTQSTVTYNGTEIMSGAGTGLNLIYLQEVMEKVPSIFTCRRQEHYRPMLQ